MKKTKEKHWWKIFWRSKYISSLYKEDKQKIIAKYKDNAFRDAEISFDTTYNYDEKSINIEIKIKEGKKYYIRSIDWTGNLKYRSGYLDTILGIASGDEYNQSVLDARLYIYG